MVSARRRIKLFNRTLQEFIKECKKIINVSSIPDKNEFQNIQFLNTFNQEVNFVKDNFFNCNIECLENISLCKKLMLSDSMKGNLSLEDKKCVWKYLHNLYLMTVEDISKEDDVIEKSKIGLENLKETSADMVPSSFIKSNSFNPGGEMGGLIQEVSKQLSKKLEGKDLSGVNPMNLISTLLGNSGSGNAPDQSSSSSIDIDFGSILKDVTETIQTKVNKGELNLENLKNEAKTMINNNPQFKHNNEINKVLDLD